MYEKHLFIYLTKFFELHWLYSKNWEEFCELQIGKDEEVLVAYLKIITKILLEGLKENKEHQLGNWPLDWELILGHKYEA